jgi:hypothetical protein
LRRFPRDFSGLDGPYQKLARVKSPRLASRRCGRAAFQFSRQPARANIHSDNFERHYAVVDNTVFGREALQALEADVAHGCEEFIVVLRNILLSGERSIQAIEGRSIPDDVVGVKIERRFDFIDYLTMKVFFHAFQVSSNTVVVHRFPIRMLVVTNPQLMLAEKTRLGWVDPSAGMAACDQVAT